MKKTLNVHFSANLIDESIVKFLKQDFEINIINLSKNDINSSKQEVINLLKKIDLIIFTGGEDVHPSFYGEKIGKYTHTNEKRDILEWELLNIKKIIPDSIIKSIPKLGICRGAQLLTVYNGGSLIQHVEGHRNNEQIIEINIGRENNYNIKISSDHHQMMYPYNLPESYYELIGYSKNFQSNTYLNGDNNEIDLPKNFLEPEIIYYKNKNSLCIQSHPEWCIGSDGSNFCLELINKYLLKDNSKIEIKQNFQLIDNKNKYPISDNIIKNNEEDFLYNHIFENKENLNGLYGITIKKDTDDYKKYKLTSTIPVENAFEKVEINNIK